MYAAPAQAVVERSLLGWRGIVVGWHRTQAALAGVAGRVILLGFVRFRRGGPVPRGEVPREDEDGQLKHDTELRDG